MSSSNRMMFYVFSDGKLIQIRAEIAQSQISDGNNNMLFHFPPAPVQVQSNNYEKQKSNDDTTDQLQQHQSVQSLIKIVEQQPCNSTVDNNVENRYNENSFLLELVSTVQNYPAVWNITTRSYRDLNTKPGYGKIQHPNCDLKVNKILSSQTFCRNMKHVDVHISPVS